MLVVPNWPTQPWYTKLMQMVRAYPGLLPIQTDILTHPSQKGSCHPLWQRLHLMAWKLSGQLSKSRVFRQSMQTPSLNHGDQVQAGNTNHISGNGYSIAIKRVLIQLIPLWEKTLEFILGLFKKGLGYSSLNIARCALSCILAPNNWVLLGHSP